MLWIIFLDKLPCYWRIINKVQSFCICIKNSQTVQVLSSETCRIWRVCTPLLKHSTLQSFHSHSEGHPIIRPCPLKVDALVQPPNTDTHCIGVNHDLYQCSSLSVQTPSIPTNMPIMPYQWSPFIHISPHNTLCWRHKPPADKDHRSSVELWAWICLYYRSLSPKENHKFVYSESLGTIQTRLWKCGITSC